jgi:hypothetical protein
MTTVSGMLCGGMWGISRSQYNNFQDLLNTYREYHIRQPHPMALNERDKIEIMSAMETDKSEIMSTMQINKAESMAAIENVEKHVTAQSRRLDQIIWDGRQQRTP